MQMVEAKCIMDAWDSPACMPYKQGQTYEIDREGPLAKLKTPRGNPVFEFDRNAGPDDKPHNYSCKKPGCEDLKPFKTLAELGRHSNSAHKDDPNPMASDEEIFIPKDMRGKKKGKTFTCKHPGCGVVLPHLYALKVHKKTHEKDAVAQAA